MIVRELYGIDAAPNAEGHVVVIDVLRAFTTAAYAFAAGAEAIVLVKDPEEAFALKKKNQDLLLAGEIDGRPIPGFDYGNSPEVMSRQKLAGRRLVLRSSSGTQGVVAAKGADQVLLGSLVVARATALYLKLAGPKTATLLAMGSQQALDKEEDLACSDYMAALLADKTPDKAEFARRVRESPAGRNALDPKVDWISPEDVDRAVEVDRFDFAMPVANEYGLLIARKVRPVRRGKFGGTGLRAGPAGA